VFLIRSVLCCDLFGNVFVLLIIKKKNTKDGKQKPNMVLLHRGVSLKAQTHDSRGKFSFLSAA
jgi:hypothetical protein